MKKLLIVLLLITRLVPIAVADTIPSPTLPPCSKFMADRFSGFDYFAAMAAPQDYIDNMYWITGKVLYADEYDIDDEQYDCRLITYVAIDNAVNQIALMAAGRNHGDPAIVSGDEIGFIGTFAKVDNISMAIGDVKGPWFVSAGHLLYSPEVSEE